MSTITPTSTVYAADAVHSQVGFEIKHLGVATFRAHFAGLTGQLVEDADGRLSLSGRVRVEGISVTQEDFRGHLLSPEFFDADAHPVISFESEDIQLDGNGNATVTGDLTIKGITRPVTATGTISPAVQSPFGPSVRAARLETTIDRNDFGISWNMDLPTGGKMLADQVKIVVELELAADSGAAQAATDADSDLELAA